jgi:hypothetical protein
MDHLWLWICIVALALFIAYVMIFRGRPRQKRNSDGSIREWYRD